MLRKTIKGVSIKIFEDNTSIVSLHKVSIYSVHGHYKNKDYIMSFGDDQHTTYVYPSSKDIDAFVDSIIKENS